MTRSYDLSFNRYKEVVHAETAQRRPEEILVELTNLEHEIEAHIQKLQAMVS